MAEILASLSDINAYLENQVIEATGPNTEILQISASRVVRGYLSRVIDNSILATWTEPSETPDVVREIAGMLIASQLFFDKTTLSTVEIDQRHYAQILYDRAMKMLEDIVNGIIVLPIDTPVEPIDSMTGLDYFPIDDTDRAFTMSLEL